MVRLRKNKNKLKIALCSILGFFVAIGGVLGILVLAPLMEGEKVMPEVESAVSEKNDPGGKTFEEHLAEGDGGYKTLTYLAYVLSRQPYYHSEANTVSTSMSMSQYTNSYKDYKDGVLISSDVTYGVKNEGTQAVFLPDGDENGRGAGVYMRKADSTISSESTGTENIEWGEDVTYYDRDSYLVTYGEYSTEMTVYLLTSETITDWDDAVDNGDGTYTQKFYLDAEKAAYYYQYAMKTRGGLLMLPVFTEITLLQCSADRRRGKGEDKPLYLDGQHVCHHDDLFIRRALLRRGALRLLRRLF